MHKKPFSNAWAQATWAHADKSAGFTQNKTASIPMHILLAAVLLRAVLFAMCAQVYTDSSHTHSRRIWLAPTMNTQVHTPPLGPIWLAPTTFCVMH